MKTRRFLRQSLTPATLLLTLVPQLVSLPARAQGTDDAVTMQARARFKEGVDFFDKGQYENARIAFLQAYALRKHPAVLLNLAQSSAKANHPLEAARYFQQFLREATEATPQQRKDAEAGLADARQKLGRIEIVAPPGTEITLDDKEKLGAAPFADAVDVDPGPHALKSSSETVRVAVSAGAKVQAHFGSAASAPVAAPVVAPTTGEPAPATTAKPAEPVTETEPPAEPAKHTSLLSPPETMAPVYVGLAVGGAGLVSAILFGVFKADAQSKSDGVTHSIQAAALQRGLSSKGICVSSDPAVQRDFSGACRTLANDNHTVNTDATIANVSLVVMGVGFATAAGWYLFAPKRNADHRASTKPSVVAAPYAGYGSGGFTVRGTF